MSSEAAEVLAAAEPEQFSAGDLVWAKQNGYPWWPALVAPEPGSRLQYRSFSAHGSRQLHIDVRV